MLDDVEWWLTGLASKACERRENFNSRPKNVAENRQYIWNSSIKNKEIKEKLTHEGKLLRYKPRSSFDRKAHEWLYDLVWREFDDRGNFLGVTLAAEIELSDWKARGLIYDLNKLLQADAPEKSIRIPTKDARRYSPKDASVRDRY